jgi:hypothetical protein
MTIQAYHVTCTLHLAAGQHAKERWQWVMQLRMGSRGCHCAGTALACSTTATGLAAYKHARRRATTGTLVAGMAAALFARSTIRMRVTCCCTSILLLHMPQGYDGLVNELAAGMQPDGSLSPRGPGARLAQLEAAVRQLQSGASGPGVSAAEPAALQACPCPHFLLDHVCSAVSFVVCNAFQVLRHPAMPSKIVAGYFATSCCTTHLQCPFTYLAKAAGSYQVFGRGRLSSGAPSCRPNGSGNDSSACRRISRC